MRMLDLFLRFCFFASFASSAVKSGWLNAEC